MEQTKPKSDRGFLVIAAPRRPPSTLNRAVRPPLLVMDLGQDVDISDDDSGESSCSTTPSSGGSSLLDRFATETCANLRILQSAESGHTDTSDCLTINHPPSDRSVSQPHPAQLFMRREAYGSFLPWTRGTPPQKLASESFGVVKDVRLIDILENGETVVNAGHIFLGFTQDGRYLLSYTSVDTSSWMFPFGIGLFPEESQKDFCKLHFWRFSPFAKSTTRVHSVVLFRGACNQAPQTPIQLTVAQWPDDNDQLVVLGYWDDSTHFLAPSSERQVTVSVIPVPRLPLSSGPPYEIHTSPLTTCFPHPSFDPAYCLLIPNVIIVPGGDLVLIYRFLESSPSDSPRDPYHFGQRPSKKRKIFASQNSDIWSTGSEDKNDGVNEMVHEFTNQDTDNAIIREVFYRNSTSQLVDCFGEEISSHPLQDLFRHVGAPIFHQRNMEDGTGADIELTSVRMDILMERAWRFARTHLDIGALIKKRFVCSTDTVSAERQEVVFKACFFVERLEKKSMNLSRALQLHAINTAFPFYLHLDHISGGCTMFYYPKSRKDAPASSVRSWVSNEAQQHRVMNELLLIADLFHKKRDIFRTVHTMNNFGVERGKSLKSLVTPDGCITITL